MQGRVEILRDANGVSHVYADNEHVTLGSPRIHQRMSAGRANAINIARHAPGVRNEFGSGMPERASSATYGSTIRLHIRRQNTLAARSCSTAATRAAERMRSRYLFTGS